MSASPLAVTLTVAELRKVVAEAVRDASTPQQEAEVLTREQAAEILQVSLPVVMKYVHERGLPAHPLGPREWRFRRSEILQWVADQKVGSR